MPPLDRGGAGRLAPWLVAMLVYVGSLAGLGLVLVDDTIRVSQNLLAARLTVQVPAAASDARIRTVVAVLQQTPGVRSVHLLEPAETARLLEPWLGSPVPIDELPVPQLIDVALDRGDVVDMAKLKQQLTAIVPDLRLDDHHSGLAGLRAGARAVQTVLGAVVGAALLLVAALAAFATGAALAARWPEVELLHLLGAADRAIAWRYAMRSLLYSLVGAAIGVAAVLTTLAVLGRGAGLVRLAAPVAAPATGDWRLWAVLAAMALAAGLVASASASATVLRRLARMP